MKKIFKIILIFLILGAVIFGGICLFAPNLEYVSMHNGLTTTIYIKVNNPEQHTLSANDFSIISDGKVVKASKINDKESYKVYEEDEIVEIQFYTTKADVPLTIFYKDKELNLKFKTFIFEI